MQHYRHGPNGGGVGKKIPRGVHEYFIMKVGQEDFTQDFIVSMIGFPFIIALLNWTIPLQFSKIYIFKLI
jgi:hypothetical protein